MELTQILIIVGAIAIVIFAIVAIRGSFRNDDAFYGESTPPANVASTTDDHGSHGSSGDVGGAHDGGSGGDGGAGGSGGDSGSSGGGDAGGGGSY